MQLHIDILYNDVCYIVYSFIKKLLDLFIHKKIQIPTDPTQIYMLAITFSNLDLSKQDVITTRSDLDYHHKCSTIVLSGSFSLCML